MDAQQQHDAAMRRRKAMRGRKLEAGSKQRVEALLAAKSAASSTPERSTAFDPLASVMKQHGLTEARARELAELFGF